MRPLPPTLAALATTAFVGALLVAAPAAASADTSPGVRITEWMYNPTSSVGEFVEITNVSTSPVSLAGWSFDDADRVPGATALDSLGTLAAGESAIITEATAAAFRTAWNLGAGVKVLGGSVNNLGRSDEINIFSGTDAVASLVDRLTYNDQGTGTVKGPRTAGTSGVPISAAALGANDASQWQLSTVGDAEGSFTATPADIGSPGKSRFGAVNAWANVRINEVSSDNSPALPLGDAIELYNGSSSDVSIAGWLQTDSSAATAATTFSAKLADGSATTVVPAGGFVYFSSTKGLGSGGDSVKLYLPDGTLVDSVDYTAGEAGTDEGNNFGAGSFARCPDGSGAFVSVAGKSFGASNATPCASPLTNPADNPPATLTCQPEAASGTGVLPSTAVVPATWPGASTVAVADTQCAFTTATGPEGRDISGLIFDPSNSGVLWAVKNKSWVYRLVKSGGLWVPDTADGWSAGKEIFFPGSTTVATNQPDSEGLTIGADGALYVTTERNNASNTNPLNSILRFDPAASGTQLVATDQWDLTAEFPELHAGNKTEANLGFEGVTFVPDSYLTGNGFVDQSTGEAYDPADYPLHGTGLFFAALENDGKLYAYALNSDYTFSRVAVVDTKMGHVMDVQFDAATQRIWALCDNTCGVVSTLLKVGPTGAIVPDVAYARPIGLPNNNIEGFAQAAASTCVDGVKEAVWADDGIYGAGAGSATEGHALFSGTVSCDLDLGSQGAQDATAPVVDVKVSPAASASGWRTSATTVTITADDGARGSGVASIEYRLDGGGWAAYTAPVPLPDGTTVIDARATDVASNVSATVSATAKVDTEAPVSNAIVDEDARTVTVRAADATSGIAEIQVDAGDGWVTYAGPVSVGDDATAVRFRAVDKAGNVESANVASVPEAGEPLAPSATVALGAYATRTYGQTNTIVVKVGGTGATPTGTVGVVLDDVEIATGTLDAQGRATLTIPGLAVKPGTRELIVRYAGSATYAASEDVVDVTVTKAPTKISASLPRTVITSGVGRIKVAVTSAVPADGTVSVMVSTSSQPLVANVPLVDGKATIILPKMTNKVRSVWVVYSGSDTTLASKSAKHTLVTRYPRR